MSPFDARVSLRVLRNIRSQVKQLAEHHETFDVQLEQAFRLVLDFGIFEKLLKILPLLSVEKRLTELERMVERTKSHLGSSHRTFDALTRLFTLCAYQDNNKEIQRKDYNDMLCSEMGNDSSLDTFLRLECNLGLYRLSIKEGNRADASKYAGELEKITKTKYQKALVAQQQATAHLTGMDKEDEEVAFRLAVECLKSISVSPTRDMLCIAKAYYVIAFYFSTMNDEEQAVQWIGEAHSFMALVSPDGYDEVVNMALGFVNHALYRAGLLSFAPPRERDAEKRQQTDSHEQELSIFIDGVLKTVGKLRHDHPSRSRWMRTCDIYRLNLTGEIARTR